jgi:hypothetical protein
MNRTFVAVVTMFALAWLAAECVILVGAGVWWPILAYFVVFALAMLWLGCIPLDAAKTEQLGTLFVAVIVLALLAFAVGNFVGGGTVAGVVKVVLALAYAALAWRGTRTVVGATA